MTLRREPIYGLDVIRFSAACFVLVWHAGYRFFDPSAVHIRQFVRNVPPGWHPWEPVAQFGWIGVQVFFVISGLVISYSATGATPYGFVVGRISRLWPAALMTVLIVLAIDILFLRMGVHPLLKPAIKTAFFFPVGPWLMPQFWTLPVEIVFYILVWAFIAAGRSDRLIMLATALTVASGAYWTLYQITGHTLLPLKLDRILLLQHGFYFSIGIAFAQLRRGQHVPLLSALIGGGFVLAAFEIRYALTKYGLHAAGPATWLVPYAIWAMLVGGIWLSLRHVEILSRIFNARPLLARTSRIMGLITYPLYLIHIHVAGLAMTLAASARFSLPISLIIGGLIAIGTATILAVFCEPPLRRLTGRVLAFRVSSQVKSPAKTY